MNVIREAKETEKDIFNRAARHPLQSWEWGEFRKQTGVALTRLVEERDGKIRNVYQITWHRIPKTPFCIGYCPKSALPSAEALKSIEKEAQKRRIIFVKFEPSEKAGGEITEKIKALQKGADFREGKALFTKYSLWLDLTLSEEELLAKMHPKTRYNVRLAQKKGVEVIEDPDGFEDYWRLTEETTRRQGFYSHTKNYHRKMWKEMHDSGMGHLLKAVYQGEVLTTWILFVLNGVLYYPYGASSSTQREVMASNLMMWEAIRLGKKHKCGLFDMWGSLGPEPDEKDPWYGFHRFKQGYGPELIEFVGTYDLVVNPGLYRVYGALDKVRWALLKIAARIKRQ